jgi:hypothetical protein
LISVKVHLQSLTTNFFSAGSLIGLFIHLKTGRNYFNAVVQGVFEGCYSAVIRENGTVIRNIPALIGSLYFLFPSSFILVQQTPILSY